MKFLSYILLLIGFLVTGVIATGTAMTFQWPGFVILGAAALASVTILFQGKIRGASSFCLICGILMTAYVVWRAAYSPVVYFAREDAALAVACFCVYTLIAVVFGSSKWRLGLIGVLAVLVVANLGLGAYQQAVDMKRWVFDGYMRTYEDRIGGVFNNPNHFAALLAVAVPIFLSTSIFGRNHAPTLRLLLGFLSVMSLLAIGASKSRGGFLAAGVGLVVFSILSLPRIWRNLETQKARMAMIAVSLFVAAGIGGVTIVNLEMITERLGSAAFSKATEMNRPLMWRSALDQNAESPLIGTGARTFYFYSRKHRSTQMHVSVPEADFAHNEYFQAVADYGWIGLTVFGICMLIHTGHGWKFLRQTSDTNENGNDIGLVIGALSGLAAVLAHACFDFVLHIPILAIITSALLAILAVPGQQKKLAIGELHVSKFTSATCLFTRTVCPGIGTALLIFGVMYARSEWHFEMARLRYESNSGSLEQLDHLRQAREIDPHNPFAHSLGANAYVAAITPEMPLAVQDAYFEKAESHYRMASSLYPQDVFAAIGFAEVLDAIGKNIEAEQVLNNARSWAPLYGPIMQAQAEHWLRVGNVDLAESYYHEARDAGAFRDWRAALSGLEKIAEWRKLTAANAANNAEKGQSEKAASTDEFADLE